MRGCQSIEYFFKQKQVSLRVFVIEKIVTGREHDLIRSYSLSHSSKIVIKLHCEICPFSFILGWMFHELIFLNLQSEKRGRGVVVPEDMTQNLGI